MYWNTTFLLSFIYFISFSQLANGDDIVEWSETRSLECSDFLAEPEPASPYAAACVFALHINFEQTEYLKVILLVQANFFKSKSWIKCKSRTKINIKYVLKHEQLHFDIVELIARRYRKKILQKNFENPKVAEIYCQNLHDIMVNKLDSIQELYDKETKYTIDQEKWNQKVSRELIEYQEYANPKIEINF